MKTQFLCLLILIGLSLGCKKLPVASERQFSMETDFNWENDSLSITLINPVKCPLRVRIYHTDPEVDTLLEEVSSIVLEDLEEKTLSVLIDNWSDDIQEGLRLSASLGALEFFSPDSNAQYGLPFPPKKVYTVVQGYNGSFSHQSDFSRYAIDFDLHPGDTVCAARGGVVVGVIEGYDIGGNNRKYRPYANYLSIYHEDGVITQYVHLLKDGGLVQLGDTVTRGQPIGICGMTGFSSSPHLHFNVLKPTESSSVSMPIIFTTGAGADLKKGMVVSYYTNIDLNFSE